MLWFFGILAVGGLYLLVHAAIYAANIGFVVVAAGPAAITGALAFTSWSARREAREGLARAEFTDLAAANEREEQLGNLRSAIIDRPAFQTVWRPAHHSLLARITANEVAVPHYRTIAASPPPSRSLSGDRFPHLYCAKPT